MRFPRLWASLVTKQWSALRCFTLTVLFSFSSMTFATDEEYASSTILSYMLGVIGIRVVFSLFCYFFISRFSVLSCFETRPLAVSFHKPATHDTSTVLRLIFVIRFEIRFSQALLQKVDALLNLILSVFLWLYPKLTRFRYIPNVMEYILYLLLSLTLGIVFGLFALLWTIWLFHRNMVTHVQVAKREIIARQVHLFSRLAESDPSEFIASRPRMPTPPRVPTPPPPYSEVAPFQPPPLMRQRTLQDATPRLPLTSAVYSVIQNQVHLDPVTSVGGPEADYAFLGARPRHNWYVKSFLHTSLLHAFFFCTYFSLLGPYFSCNNSLPAAFPLIRLWSDPSPTSFSQSSDPQPVTLWYQSPRVSLSCLPSDLVFLTFLTHTLLIMAQVAPKVTISKFSSGDPIQWSIFRQNFENWVGLFDNNVDAGVKKRYLFTFLEGDAAIKAQDLYAYVGDATKTVQNCLDDLGQLYAPAASGELAVSLFHSAKQEAHESIERWSTRCRVLYGRAFPQDDARTSPHLIHAFISGLFHPEYRPAILLKRPTTYKDALTHAQEVVAALAINDPRLATDAAGGNLAQIPEAHAALPIKQEVQAVMHHHQAPQHLYQVSAMQGRQGLRQVSPAPFAGASSSASAQTAAGCWFCNDPSHQQSRCPWLQNAAKYLNRRQALWRGGSRGRFQRGRGSTSSSSRPPYQSNKSRTPSPGRRGYSPGRVSFNQISTETDDIPCEIPVDDDELWKDFLGE